jgi:hypothetical protein
MEKRKKTVAYAPAKGAEYDRSGIVCTPAVRDALKRGEPLPGVHVVKLEGELDVASSLSILAPDEYVVFSNAHGARELLPWVIELFSKLNPASWILIGDRDAAGEAGAARWANEIMRICPGSIVRVPILPLEFSPTKGADFRDWIRSGATISDFEKLIEKTPSWTEAKKQAEAPKQKAEQQAAPMQSESVNISEHDSQAGQQLQDGSGNGAFAELEIKAQEAGIEYGDWEEDSGFEEGQAGGKAAPSDAQAIPRISFGQLATDHTEMRPVLVDGLIRVGEVFNIIGSPKTGKSFFAASLALSIATGRSWIGRDVKQGRVLIIDNELHLPLLNDRLHRIARAMEIDDRELDNEVEILSLRGRGCDIIQLGTHLQSIKPGEFALVLCDALYRFLPDRCDENSNSDMTKIYNLVDQYAHRMDAAFGLVHHTSKGSQGEKAITDAGSGAGAVSRAADSHLILRLHEQPGLVVLEGVTRSFRQPEPQSLRWTYPAWEAVTVPPVVKRRDNGQADRDAQTDAAIIDALKERRGLWLSLSQIKGAIGCGTERANRSLSRLKASGSVLVQIEDRKGAETQVYRFREEGEEQ